MPGYVNNHWQSITFFYLLLGQPSRPLILFLDLFLKHDW